MPHFDVELVKEWMESMRNSPLTKEQLIDKFVESCDRRLGPFNKRQEAFRDSLIKYVPKYGKAIIGDFYRYWSEEDRGRKPKMRFEKEKTWNLVRRLDRWEKNNS